MPEIKKLLGSEQSYYQYLGEIFYGNYLELFQIKKEEALSHYKKADLIGEKNAGFRTMTVFCTWAWDEYTKVKARMTRELCTLKNQSNQLNTRPIGKMRKSS